MILHDTEIQRLIQEERMIEPFEPELLNPASLDLRLGDNIMVEVEHTSELQIQSIAHCSADNPYWLAPGEFVLAETRETFNMPNDVCGMFCLKSSRAREGYEHSHAGFADPEWCGSKLTLELVNARRLHSLPLYPGLKIGQMVFVITAGIPHISYAEVGHYNKQPRVMPSWEHSL
jgi:dCTP deaminase